MMGVAREPDCYPGENAGQGAWGFAAGPLPCLLFMDVVCLMRDTGLYEQILGLAAPWQVTEVTMDQAAQIITVRIELPPAATLACPSCHRAGCTIKDRQERQWRHLDTCQFKTLISAPLPRTECEDCGVKTVAPPWSQKHSRFTLQFERFAIDALLEMSVTGACRLLRLSWDEADGIVARAVGRGLERRELSKLRRIGIDEKAVLKGHHYITVVYDLDTAKVVWMGEDRTEETLDGFFAGLPQEVLGQIECLTMDMWKPYRASCRKWIAGADEKTVLDRFHLERHLNEAVNDVRKQEARELKEEGIDLLDKTKWDWLYRPENLPPARVERFLDRRQYDLKTGRAHAIKENLRRMWDYVFPEGARRFFKDWYFWATHSRLSPMIKVAKMFNNHLERIISYFRLRATNSTAEGINNKIQTIKKKAYGFRNVQRFINAIYFHCGGLQLYPL
jgi:transposase